jgi:hypothetical protein
MEMCRQLCQNIAVHICAKSAKSATSILSGGKIPLPVSKNITLDTKTTATRSVMLSGPSSVDSFFLRLVGSNSSKRSTAELNETDCICCVNNAASMKVQECHAVNGICLEDLEAFETQLREVKNVNAAFQFHKADTMPIHKASILGSKSASSGTKLAKASNDVNPRLSLSCNSNISARASANLSFSSVKSEPSPNVSPQLMCGDETICLTKVRTLLTFCQLDFKCMAQEMLISAQFVGHVDCRWILCKTFLCTIRKRAI